MPNITVTFSVEKPVAGFHFLAESVFDGSIISVGEFEGVVTRFL